MLVTGSIVIFKKCDLWPQELAFQFERKMIKHAVSIKWQKFYNRGCTEG